jgi:hypothetical protein
MAAVFLVNEQVNNLIFYFWRIYEMNFPERSHVKAPNGFRFSLWSLSFLPF